MPPSLTSFATSRVVGAWPRSKSNWCVAIRAADASLFSLFIRQSRASLIPPEREQVVDRFLERNLRRPTSLLLNARAIAEHDWRVVRTQTPRVLLDRDLHPCLRDKEVDERSNRRRRAGTHVVRHARLRRLHQRAIAAHGVAHVHDVALRRHVAH